MQNIVAYAYFLELRPLGFNIFSKGFHTQILRFKTATLSGELIDQAPS